MGKGPFDRGHVVMLSGRLGLDLSGWLSMLAGLPDSHVTILVYHETGMSRVIASSVDPSDPVTWVARLGDLIYILIGITCSDYPVREAKLYGCFIVE
jgi:hypothetical protein